MAGIEWAFYALIPTFILLHLWVSPYTKVEESFNIQAIHDILIHGIPNENADQFLTANYDHMSFPGSVPRTFVGALILGGLSRPFVWLLNSPAQLQFLVRAILGLLNAAALVAFGRSIARVFGKSAGIWYALFQASQFHVIYYASRTLPNMFAFIFTNIALQGLLNAHAASFDGKSIARSYRLSLYLLTFAGVVFRSELAILVATVTLYLLATRSISIVGVIIPAGLAGAVIGLITTVSVDSFLWQTTPLWPEWTAFYYNTIQGHSADWGVSPWYFYFVNALPRLMINPLTYLFCIPAALLPAATRARSLDLLVPTLTFVGLFSFLPHKEWRFIIYIVPALTGVAAAGASWIWTRRGKTWLYAALSLALIGSVLVSFVASIALLAISSLNYPGGEAIHYLHNNIDTAYGVHWDHTNVYFDNLACQTGVTRFLENHEGPQTIVDVLEAQDLLSKRKWTYDKTEDPGALLDPMFWSKFHYVLAENPAKIIGAWSTVHVVYGFGGIRVLKPGEESGSPVEPLNVVARTSVADETWTTKVAQLWHTAEKLVRYRLLRGWWVEVRMEPKIRILENQALYS
ncbi:glycosyltransferase family 22 protein [Karstenula rhodostoma CBS 690.94]|uniref:Mannosyltransferase n=1 Tax=Karstenula rhodostoma CBS 690.94 TaxID=1392251 RepID=A0A9P4PDV2_9PLEO|nr:glycosyltransferase family 22 protein [Karstenula rhodostoma CBS 690.94]